MSIIERTFMRRRGPARLVALAALGLTLAGCASVVAGRPSPIYDLTAPGQASAARGSLQVLVPEPTTVRALDTDRIAARPAPGQYAYLPDAVWSDRLPKLVQTRLVQTLQNSGRARAVSVPGQGLLIDRQIVIDIRAFEYSATEGAVIDVAARVMDDRNGRVLRSQVFRQTVPVAQPTTPAIVQALDQAMGAAFVDLTVWALR